MVRAAVSGAVDYSLADPTDPKWRLRHRLLLTEIQRKEEQTIADYLHRHYCAYVSHGGLTESSFLKIKEATTDSLSALQHLVFPWLVEDENKEEKGTIDKESQELMNRYKTWRSGAPSK